MYTKLNEFGDVFFNDVPVLIHSNDMFYLECVLKTQMRTHFKSMKTMRKHTFNDVAFDANEEFLVFDMKDVATQFAEFNEYVKFLCQNKAIFEVKKTMILKNMHCVSRTHQLWFAHNIRALMRYYGIVATSMTTNTLCPQIMSNFLGVKRYPEMHTLLSSYAQYAKLADDTDEIIQNCVKYDKDLFASLLAIQTKSCSLFIEHDIQKIAVSIKKTKHVSIFLSKVRAFVYRFMVYNVPHQRVIRAIWHCVNTKYKKKPLVRSKLLNELCTLDTNILHASKPLYHYERFFLVMFELLQ